MGIPVCAICGTARTAKQYRETPSGTERGDVGSLRLGSLSTRTLQCTPCGQCAVPAYALPA
eukprot:1557128-Rhodomonas_salina.2